MASLQAGANLLRPRPAGQPHCAGDEQNTSALIASAAADVATQAGAHTQIRRSTADDFLGSLRSAAVGRPKQNNLVGVGKTQALQFIRCLE